MDYSQVFAISAAGMTVQRTRVDIATLNLANANTVQDTNGRNYRPLQVIARSAGASFTPFSQMVDQAGVPDFTWAGAAMPMATIEPANVQPRLTYEPGHPFANERGFVAYPGVDTATEMVTLMTAMRSYEANVAAMNTARTLALKALDIGGNA